LSVHTARRHYPDTVLVTDREGKRLLVDRLGLPFVHVSTELDRLRTTDIDWWALGKLVAYSLQDRPFVHLDSDAFLWNALPRSVAAAPVFTQCPGPPHRADERWSPAAIEAAFAAEGLSLPAEWEWARSRDRTVFREEACGIVGGSHLPFLRHYATTALKLVRTPAHARAWDRLSRKTGFNMVIEQFLLAACLEFHRAHPASPYRGVRVRHLFRSWEASFDEARAARVGYAHLLLGRWNPGVARRLESRMRREDPAYVQRCVRVLASGG